MRGNPSHFDERLFAVKPHPGSARAPPGCRDDLEYGAGAAAAAARASRTVTRSAAPPRDRRAARRAACCSARCWRSRSTASTTTRSSTPSGDEILHGGNFYGGHVAFAMDGAQDRRRQRGRPARSADGAAVQPDDKPRPARQPGRAGRDRARRPPRLQGDADHRLGADRRGAEADHAGQRVQPQHRVAQPGQGQHGIDRRARLPARSGAERDGRDRRAARPVPGGRPAGAGELQAPQPHPARRGASAGPRNDGDRRQDVDIAGILAVYRRGELPVG